MEPKEQFLEVLAEFSRDAVMPVELSPEGSAVIDAGDVIVNVHYLPASDRVLAWATLGFLGDDRNASLRVNYLLEKHDGLIRTKGFTFSVDLEDDKRVLVHDTRPVAFFENGDRLAAWLGDLLTVVEETREEIARIAPYDEPFGAETAAGRER